MQPSLRILTAITIISSLAACSQDDASVQVNNKGHLFYGHDGIQKASYVTNATPALNKYAPDPYTPDYRAGNGHVDINTRSMNTTPQTVQTSSISVTEIAPPEGSWARTESKPSPLERSSSNATFISPVEGSVVSGYGKRPNGAVNDGINYLLPAGEPVYASAGGEVAYIGDELKSYGHMAIIKHNNGYNTSYAHLSRATVEKGQQVRQGQIIGYVGQTGNVAKPQLHFAIRKGSEPVDPNTLLSKQLAAN